ncbi:hypothetical protein GCM10009677_47860 [Sphaerisporangium rubeum]
MSVSGGAVTVTFVAGGSVALTGGESPAREPGGSVSPMRAKCVVLAVAESVSVCREECSVAMCISKSQADESRIREESGPGS